MSSTKGNQTPNIRWVSASSVHQHADHRLKEIYKNSEFRCDHCKVTGRGLRLKCETCKSYKLHDGCANPPATLESEYFDDHGHPLHLKRTSRLLTCFLPCFSSRCSLCRHYVIGAAYKCTEKCRIVLHPLCSQLPRSVADHTLHPTHPLKLTKEKKARACDVCEKKCRGWRYNCEVCEVHIHVDCLELGIDVVKAKETRKIEKASAFLECLVAVLGLFSS